MTHPIASMVDSYLAGKTSKEETASQIASFVRGDITAAGVDQQKVQKFGELMEAVQPQTTPFCAGVTVGISVIRCTAIFGC